MASTIAFMCVTVLAINYAGVLLAPGLAIHSAAGPQPEHVGLWRGSFAHKNTAGQAMACLMFAGIYVSRRGWAWVGPTIVLGAMVFMYKTGAKTTFALAPLAALIVIVPSIVGWRSGPIVAFLLGVGIAAISPIDAWRWAFGDLTRRFCRCCGAF